MQEHPLLAEMCDLINSKQSFELGIEACKKEFEGFAEHLVQDTRCMHTLLPILQPTHLHLRLPTPPHPQPTLLPHTPVRQTALAEGF